MFIVLKTYAYGKSVGRNISGEATEKRPKNSTVKPLSKLTISVPCMKIQDTAMGVGSGGPCPPGFSNMVQI